MSDKHRQQRREEERSQGTTPSSSHQRIHLPPPPSSIAHTNAGAGDNETAELLVKLSQLGAMAIAVAGKAIDRSQSMIPTFEGKPPDKIPTLGIAVWEQARAFRFAACAAQIDKAIQELKRPLDVPPPADSPADDG